MINLILFILFSQISIDNLINQLGDKDYQVREKAKKSIKKLEFKAIDKLKNNFDNKDLEISLSCRYLYDEYFFITDKDGKVPSIWYLDEKIRFPLGYNVIINKKKKICVLNCKKDISLEYVDKIKPEINFMIHHEYYCTEEFCFCFCCCDYCYYRSEKVGIVAMKKYIKDYLASGKDRETLIKIIQKASDNSKNNDLSYRVKNLNSEYWESYNNPPGIMIKD